MIGLESPTVASALAGAASSPVRAGAAVGGAPFVQVRGRGAYAYDEQERAYVDYVMAYGPLLFGHAPPALLEGLDELASLGTVFGSTHPEEIRLAGRISRHLPCMERLRFVSTGTEAVMSALRVARAATGRTLILRFAGNYHGHFDAALVAAGASAQTGDSRESGIPPRAVADIVVARYNDLADVDRLLAARWDDLAAIVVEPLVANMGLVEPVPEFLTGLFERARGARALMIFDEVITWLRLGLGGAQALLGFEPDLTTLGKVMGGGFPLAAFGGRADVMAALAPGGASFTGGTYSGNPFGVAMGHRVLDLLERDPAVWARLEAAGQRLADGLRRVLRAYELPYAVSQRGSMVDFKFRPGPPVRNYDEARAANGTAFARYYHAMRARGVLLAPSQNELMFLSTAHGECEIDATIRAAEGALGELRAEGMV
ncbi:MAG: glutamate-1-semialdehyde 2,1-aminomutase [Candidatus Baltobacteraceae bacterium]